MIRKTTLMLLITFVIISFLGCDVKKEQEANKENDKTLDCDTEFFYVKEYLTTFKMNEVHDFIINDTNLIIVGSIAENNINEDGHSEEILSMKVLRFDLEGHLLHTTTIDSLGINIYPSSAVVDKAGNILILYMKFVDAQPLFFMERYDIEGEYYKTIYPDLSNFTTYTNLNVRFGNETDGRSDHFFISADDSEKSFTAYFDESGVVLFEIQGINSLCELADARIIGGQKSINENSFYEIDITTGSLRNSGMLTFNPSAYYIGSGDSGQFDLLEIDIEAVYGLMYIDGTRTKLLDWNDQGLYFHHINRYTVMHGDDIYSLQSDNEGFKLLRFTQADQPPNIIEKKIINLAYLYNLGEYRAKSIMRFNTENPEYYIKPKKYDDLTSLNIDLIAGNVPDILVAEPGWIPFTSHGQKGLFIDLYELFDNDPDISRTDYIESVLNALESDDGHLYALTDRFHILTVIGRVSEVERKHGLTWEDFHILMLEKPMGTIPMAQESRQLSRDDFLSMTLWYNISEFVDFVLKKSYFDTPAFTSFLEMVSYYPVRATTISSVDFQTGNVLFMEMRLQSFLYEQTIRIESEFFNEETFYIGYPTADGINGSIIRPSEDLLAISTKSEVKDGSLEYLKFILTDFQYEQGGGMAFPIKLSALSEYADSTREQFYDDDLWDYSTQKIYALIDSLSRLQDAAPGITTIVMEEVPAYFNGQKPVEEVAAIIQNRVTVFLAEMD
ncbi:MAG: ABC transporter substrate-binding protein [Lachnospiraceae bacterium]|jgi:multiple sugar transport system substrate-binding protein|nr:ABC transporter substrate-binding protein [Lachnospiraceae bacterium]